MYKLIDENNVMKDGSIGIPFSEGNTDYAQYLAWLAEGNTPLPADSPHPNIAIDAQIATLEGKTERGIREGMLYTLVVLAASQGITEPQLYASNYGYRKAKDLDTQIAALRVQRI